MLRQFSNVELLTFKFVLELELIRDMYLLLDVESGDGGRVEYVSVTGVLPLQH